MVRVGGFNEFVINTLKTAPGDDSNAMRCLMSKLKNLKMKIKEWVKDNRSKMRKEADNQKEVLKILDVNIDNGKGTEEIVKNKGGDKFVATV